MEQQDESALWAFTPFARAGSGFIDRLSELSTLRRNYQQGRRLGIIIGGVGEGKTSLAHVFVSESPDLFPGGVKYVYATRASDLRYPTPRGSRSLLIIDEAHFLSPSSVPALEVC